MLSENVGSMGPWGDEPDEESHSLLAVDRHERAGVVTRQEGPVVLGQEPVAKSREEATWKVVQVLLHDEREVFGSELPDGDGHTVFLGHLSSKMEFIRCRIVERSDVRPLLHADSRSPNHPSAATPKTRRTPPT